MRARAVLLLAAVVLPLPVAACGGGGGSSVPAVIAQTSPDLLPSTVLGLTVKRENVKQRIGSVRRPYVRSTGLYSLREGKELQATLQVSQFNDKADVSDPTFRLAIVNQIGSTQPQPFRMGAHTVYLTTAKRQAVAIFFDRHSFAVLSTLDTYDRGRALLRALLEMDL